MQYCGSIVNHYVCNQKPCLIATRVPNRNIAPFFLHTKTRDTATMYMINDHVHDLNYVIHYFSKLVCCRSKK